MLKGEGQPNVCWIISTLFISLIVGVLQYHQWRADGELSVVIPLLTGSMVFGWSLLWFTFAWYTGLGGLEGFLGGVFTIRREMLSLIDRSRIHATVQPSVFTSLCLVHLVSSRHPSLPQEVDDRHILTSSHASQHPYMYLASDIPNSACISIVHISYGGLHTVLHTSYMFAGIGKQYKSSTYRGSLVKSYITPVIDLPVTIEQVASQVRSSDWR
jgi:hypothetical protein